MSSSHRWILVLCMLLTFGSAHPHADAIPAKPRYDPPNERTFELQGLWRQTSAEFEGRAGLGTNFWLISADKITILTRDNGAERNSGSWTYRIDFTKAPAELDLTPVENNAGGKITYPCVLHLDGSRFTVCLQNFPQRGRPADLISRAESGIGRFVYERVK